MPNAPAPDGNRSLKLLARMKRTQFVIAIAYFFDCLVLLGYHFSGLVALEVPVIVFVVLGSMVGTVYLAHVSRWSLKLKDPTLFLPQQLVAISVALGTAIAAPQIAFQPFATLFAISAFSFMAPNANSLIVSWVAAAIGAVGVIFLEGPRLAIPTTSLAGKALTCACMFGLLARCIWVAHSFRALQRRLNEKNEALLAAMGRIESLANRDDLTGLPNRRSITGWLGEQMAICRRIGTPLCVAILDLDHFKRINDAYGHLIGDRALQLFSKEALGAIRKTDRLGRFGGEEFLLVLIGTELRNASEPLERVRERVELADWTIVDQGFRLTLTIGATEYLRGESVESLLRRADMALYLGKEAGRNRVILDTAPLTRLAAQPTIATA